MADATQVLTEIFAFIDAHSYEYHISLGRWALENDKIITTLDGDVFEITAKGIK